MSINWGFEDFRRKAAGTGDESLHKRLWPPNLPVQAAEQHTEIEVGWNFPAHVALIAGQFADGRLGARRFQLEKEHDDS